MKQVVRIIGGMYRGKKIAFPELQGLRPTPDRIKETLFNWLMQDIRGARCLDAFAGSGALGLEAFSRGASEVVFIEQAPQAYKNLHKILLDFDNPNLQLNKEDARFYLQQNTLPFDIVFLDPPFAFNYWQECLDSLIKKNNLISGGLVYLESPKPIEIDACEWEMLKTKQAGKVCYALLKKLK